MLLIARSSTEDVRLLLSAACTNWTGGATLAAEPRRFLRPQVP